MRSWPVKVERERLTGLLDRLTANLERKGRASNVLDELLNGDVAFPGLGDAIPGVDVDHDTDDEGFIVKEAWGWSGVAEILALDAVAVRDGKKKTLTEDSILWVKRLVEVFDVYIVIDGEEGELPTWTISGSIPLVNPAGDSRYSVIPTSNAK